MPQIDIATFLSLTLWSSVLYILGFLVLNLTPIITFLSAIMLPAKTSYLIGTTTTLLKNNNAILTVSPWAYI